MIPGITIPTTGKLAALFRVPIPYVLEWRINGVILASISMPNSPMALNYERPSALDLQYVITGETIREHTPNRAGMIQVSGVSGQRARAGYNRIGQVIFADGPAILLEFDEFLDAYQKGSANQQAIANLTGVPVNSDLIFRALDEGRHYRVEAQTWSWSRTAARSKTMVDWLLALQVYGPADPVVPLNVLSPVSDMFEAAAAAIDQMNAALAIASNATTNLRGDLESLRAPVLAVQRSAQALSAIAASARDLAAFPRDLVADLASVAGELRNAWETTSGAISLLDPTVGGALRAEWDRLVTEIGDVAESTARQSLTVLGYSGGGVVDLQHAALRSGETRQGLPLSPQTSAVVMLPGDDLLSVAQRTLGSRDRWTEIADLNGWSSPYRHPSGRTARSGDQVLVPARDIPQVSTGSGDPLGVDIYLTSDGELDWTSGDLRTVRGAENLTQAIRNRVFTVQAEIPMFPLYGLPTFIGEPLSGPMRGLVASHVREQMLRDQRILNLSKLEILDTGDGFSVQAELTPSNAPPYTLILPL